MTAGLAGENTLMKELIRAVVKDPRVAREVVGATLVDQTANYAKKSLDELGLAPDDKVDPVAPTGVTVLGGARALFVRWEKAPPGDRVARTIVRVQPPAPGVAREVSVPHDDGAARVPELFYNDPAGNTVTPASHSVTVRHVDRYGRSSPVFGPVTARPDPTFADQLKADTVIAGRIEALVSIASRGKITAGGASMGPNGLDLAETASSLSAPDVSRGSKITPAGTAFAAASFFNIDAASASESYPKRGMHVRVDGTAPSGFKRAQLRYEAIGNGNPGGNLHALLVVQGGLTDAPDETFVLVRPHLEVQGSLRVVGGPIVLPDNSITSREINGVSVHLLNNGGIGATIDPGLLPGLSGLEGTLHVNRTAGKIGGGRVMDRSLHDRHMVSVSWEKVVGKPGLVTEAELNARIRSIYQNVARAYARKSHKH